MLLSYANLLFVFLPVCLAGPIDQPALGDVGTGSGETSGPGQFNGELDNPALTGNLVAATPGEDYSSSINLITDPALGALPESSCGVQQSAQDRSTLLSAAEQTDANPERSTEFLIVQSREGVVPPRDGAGIRGPPFYNGVNCGSVKFAAGTRAVGPVPEQYQLAPDQTKSKPSYPADPKKKKSKKKGKTQNEFQDVQPGLVSPSDNELEPIYENGGGSDEWRIPWWWPTAQPDGSDMNLNLSF